jgi:hypothetical protein
LGLFFNFSISHLEHSQLTGINLYVSIGYMHMASKGT